MKNGVVDSIAQSSHVDTLSNDRDNRYIRGSSIGMCKRRIGYQLLGYQGQPDTGHSLFTLDLGNAIHDMIQRRLVSMGWIKARPILTPVGSVDWEQLDDPLSGCELPIVDHDLRIIGHLDGITVPMSKSFGVNELEALHPDPNGERYLIEIKSITDKPRFWVLGIRDGGTDTIYEHQKPPEFIEIDSEVSSTSGALQQRVSRFQHSRKVVSTNYGTRICPVHKVKVGGKEELITVIMIGNSVGSFSSLKEAKPKHIAQASLYANYYDIKKLLLMYIGKDVSSSIYDDESNLFNIPIKVFEYDVDPMDIEMVKAKTREIYGYTDSGELPPRDYNWGDMECNFCPFAWQCHPDRIDIDPVNNQLEKMGLPKLVRGPNVLHEPSQDLRTEYESGRPK